LGVQTVLCKLRSDDLTEFRPLLSRELARDYGGQQVVTVTVSPTNYIQQ
jgi:hypothetical protein